MPPAALTSSIAMRAPICSSSPLRAQGPESGTSMAIFTSDGFCARAVPASAAAPARLNAPRRPIAYVSAIVSVSL